MSDPKCGNCGAERWQDCRLMPGLRMDFGCMSDKAQVIAVCLCDYSIKVTPSGKLYCDNCLRDYSKDEVLVLVRRFRQALDAFEVKIENLPEG